MVILFVPKSVSHENPRNKDEWVDIGAREKTTKFTTKIETISATVYSPTQYRDSKIVLRILVLVWL